MNIYIGADHKGYELKNQVREHLEHAGVNVIDKGAMTLEPGDDYPKYAFAVTGAMLGDEGSMGILVCGSGQGMAMAANKVGGIRAAVVWSPAEARASRHDDDANVLVLPAHMIDVEMALEVVDQFVDTKFSGEERHKRRLDQIEELYG